MDLHQLPEKSVEIMLFSAIRAIRTMMQDGESTGFSAKTTWGTFYWKK